MLIRALEAVALCVPLREPFVIASARMDSTRAALVRLTLQDERSGQSACGLGEAAALPPVTREDQPELLATLARAAQLLCGARCAELADFGPQLTAATESSPVARAGLETALLDGWAKLRGVPLCTLLRGRPPRTLHTDITLPIADPAHLAELALQYRTQGFRVFKVKVGKCLDDDLRALCAVHARVPDASFRLDANGGFDATAALALVRDARRRGLLLECFEQPCARADLDGMAQLTREAGVPVIADESLRDADDLARIATARAAHGINLKLAKTGGLLEALALGERARRCGLSLMCGGMVETRLGMTASAHLACALPAVEYLDLDTAFLLASDPFLGGYVARGPELELTGGPGLAIDERGAQA